jgi:hypothetical protein
MLTRTFPPELVDEVICATGRAEQRQRLLSARVVLYYVLAMALFADSSYEEAMRHLLEGLSWQTGWSVPWQVPTKAAIFKGRMRLGVEPLAELYRRVVRPLAGPSVTKAWYRGWRVVSLEDFCLDVPDTPANNGIVGPPQPGDQATTALPLYRIVGLAESTTHVVFDVAMATAATPGKQLVPGLLRSLTAGMLCLADPNLVDLTVWDDARARGAELLWPIQPNEQLSITRRLLDGSYLAELPAGGQTAQLDRMIVRLVEQPDRAASLGEGSPCYLATTLLDPDAAPAAELSVLSAQGTTLDAAFGDLRTHQRSPKIVLRSKSPDGVQQEVYGLLLLHFAIRTFLGQPVAEARHADDLSEHVVASAQQAGV